MFLIQKQVIENKINGLVIEYIYRKNDGISKKKELELILKRIKKLQKRLGVNFEDEKI